MAQKALVPRQPRTSKVRDRAIDSIIAGYLKFREYTFSASVFLPETGLAGHELCSDEDILKLLGIPDRLADTNERMSM